MNEIIIGIDLGTTNSEVAVVRNGKSHVIEIEGSEIIPSVVGLANDGRLLVGRTAHNQWTLYPERTVRSVKRKMGEDVKISMGEQQYTPQEISAIILRRLRQAAEEFLDQKITKAVITVPAYFSDAQRQATRDAGELAGLEVVRIINEPTAAALAYEVDHTSERIILVYDLGGGTFDVSVVRVEKDVTEVLASHGNNHLGGDDFDTCIINYMVDWLKREHNVDPSNNRVAMARLGRTAEKTKIALTNEPYVQIEEEYLLEHAGKPVHLSLELSRVDYEQMITDYVNETLEAVHIALHGANLTVRDIDEILLAGGATRTPLIKQLLEQDLGMQPRSEVNPDLCVATGASIQAAVIAGQQVASVLLDITPYTFGTSALGELYGEPYPNVFIPLIRKNTAIPVTKGESFSTVIDKQEKIEVKVYQGEDKDALNNTEIGSFIVTGLSKVPAGNIIIITFSLDLNGILHVTAREKRTGLQKHISIDNATSRFKQEELFAAKERIATLMGDTSSKQSPHNITQAHALLAKASVLIEHAMADDREDLINLAEALRDALADDDEQAIEQARLELSDLIFYLEN
ncbi:heat shock protein Hsp70 [Achromatium sp. WMS1]|nr:heat shock protein Hsp70 [Achromatium sp. WMS1]